MNHARTATCVVVLSALLASGGCGPGSQQRTDAPTAEALSIEEVGVILRMYKKSGQGAPKSIKDVLGMEQGRPLAVAALRSGDVLLYWGAGLDPDDSKTVLAYQKDVPEKGGEVLLRDGSAVRMTAEEFQAAPKPSDGKIAAPPAEKTKKRG